MPWTVGELGKTISMKIWILLQLIIFKNKKVFPRIILEPEGVPTVFPSGFSPANTTANFFKISA